MKRYIKNTVIALQLLSALMLPAGQLQSFAETAAGPGVQHTSEEMNSLSDNKLEWSEINGLVSEYNATVVKNRNELNTDKRRSDDAQQISTYLTDKADDYDELAEEYQDVSAVLSATYRGTANSLRLQAESNVTDYEVIKLEYKLIEKQTDAAVRKSFLNYYGSMYAENYDNSHIAYLEKASNSVSNKKNLGMATEVELLTAQENLDNAKADLLTAQASTESNKRSLLVMCGWKYNADASIGALPEMDQASIAGIDYEADKAKAKQNNLTLKMDEIKLNNAKKESYTTYLVVEQNQNQYNNDKSSFDINFKAAYDSLVNAGTAYVNAVNNKAVGDQNLETAERQLGLGSASAMDYELAKDTAAALDLAERKAYIAMVQAKSVYDDALDGNI